MSRFFLALALCALPIVAHADERHVMLTDFDTVRVDGPFAIAVTTDASSGATISGERAAVDDVDMRITGHTLIVSRNINDHDVSRGKRHAPATITVATHRVSAATVRGGGEITLDRAEGQDVRLTVIGAGTIDVARVRADSLIGVVAGSGTLQLGGAAARARFTDSGSGTIDAAALSVRDLTATSEGTGSNLFTAERSADITALGLGSVTVSGNASCTIRGPGPVICGKVKR